MPTSFNIENIEEDLFEFGKSIEAVDMEKVKIQTVKKAAHAMSEMVRQAVVAEDDIISPAMGGPNTRGPGPSMATGDAWVVNKSGNSYTVRPHPSVEQRAVVLNYGYPGKITPDDGEVLELQVEGGPVYVEEVDGPEYTGYWQAAMRRFNAEDKLVEFAEEELDKEFDDV